MQTQNVIRAAEYLPEKLDLVIEETTDELIPEKDGIIMRLFGVVPDYSKKEYEELWQEVFNADEQKIIKYCYDKGIDILDDEKKPVSNWRDIAVMLKAIEKKIISRA